MTQLDPHVGEVGDTSCTPSKFFKKIGEKLIKLIPQFDTEFQVRCIIFAYTIANVNVNVSFIEFII